MRVYERARFEPLCVAVCAQASDLSIIERFIYSTRGTHRVSANRFLPGILSPGSLDLLTVTVLFPA
jgi:hypothetical protein